MSVVRLGVVAFFSSLDGGSSSSTLSLQLFRRAGSKGQKHTHKNKSQGIIPQTAGFYFCRKRERSDASGRPDKSCAHRKKQQFSSPLPPLPSFLDLLLTSFLSNAGRNRPVEPRSSTLQLRRPILHHGIEWLTGMTWSRTRPARETSIARNQRILLRSHLILSFFIFYFLAQIQTQLNPSHAVYCKQGRGRDTSSEKGNSESTSTLPSPPLFHPLPLFSISP